MSFNDGNMYETNQYHQRDNITTQHNPNLPNQGNKNESNEFFPAYYTPYQNDISAVS